MSDVEELRARLAQVLDPELGAPITELGMVGEVTLREGVATIAVALTTAGCPLRHQIERDVREAARGLDAVHRVDVLYEVMSPDRRASLLQRARTLAQNRAPATTIPTGSPVLMVGSGKGGVGKSSITANLAVALARTGRTVGVLDADVWGFSLTRLLGVSGEIEVRDAKMRPLVAPVGAGEIRLLSMGLLADEERALLWRGLMVQKAVAQFIEDADWSGVDYLIIDTPPGTGDIAMTLARLLPRMGLLLVTTPHHAAQRVAARSADFARKSSIRVLGVIENMSALTCQCGERHPLFGEGGGRLLADEIGVPLVASIPLRPDISEGGDRGRPVALDEDDGVFADLARRVIDDLAPPPGAVGCTARLLDALARAVEPVQPPASS